MTQSIFPRQKKSIAKPGVASSRVQQLGTLNRGLVETLLLTRFATPLPSPPRPPPSPPTPPQLYSYVTFLASLTSSSLHPCPPSRHFAPSLARPAGGPPPPPSSAILSLDWICPHHPFEAIPAARSSTRELDPSTYRR